MAVTKIHPIKSTLKKAIDYICDKDKTAEEIYVTTHLCSRANAFKEFELTKQEYQSRTKTLAHHLIQSFVPDEVTFEEAHEVGIELCKSILDDKYEYVLATHIDKGHVHNHIIFNSVDAYEGKVYHSYYGSYMQIRNESDRLCREHHLSVIDNETLKVIEQIKKRKFRSWYDWNCNKRGTSYKSRLQASIDKMIKQSQNWKDFLRLMKADGYEIKFGMHIAFKHKDSNRYTRAKTLGEDYSEENLKIRIENSVDERETTDIKTTHMKPVGIEQDDIEPVIAETKTTLGSIVIGKGNSSVAYDRWAKAHNLKTMATTLNLMAKYDINTLDELDSEIKDRRFDLNEMKKKYDKLDLEQKKIVEVARSLEICMKKSNHYKGYLKNPKDKIYKMMNNKDITAFENASEKVDGFLRQFSKYIKAVNQNNVSKKTFEYLNKRLKEITKEKSKIEKRHSAMSSEYQELNQIRSNYNNYMSGHTTNRKSILTFLDRENKRIMEDTSHYHKPKEKVNKKDLSI